jgi:hypothetical protein
VFAALPKIKASKNSRLRTGKMLRWSLIPSSSEPVTLQHRQIAPPPLGAGRVFIVGNQPGTQSPYHPCWSERFAEAPALKLRVLFRLISGVCGCPQLHAANAASTSSMHSRDHNACAVFALKTAGGMLQGLAFGRPSIIHDLVLCIQS